LRREESRPETDTERSRGLQERTKESVEEVYGTGRCVGDRRRTKIGRESTRELARRQGRQSCNQISSAERTPFKGGQNSAVLAHRDTCRRKDGKPGSIQKRPVASRSFTTGARKAQRETSESWRLAGRYAIGPNGPANSSFSCPQEVFAKARRHRTNVIAGLRLR